MKQDLQCRKCSADLNAYSVLRVPNFCPVCGQKLLKEQCKQLYSKLSDDEIGGMIKEHVLGVFYNNADEGIDADDLAYKVWERENCDGVVFYSNYTADLFAMRHAGWVSDALEYACANFGEEDHYLRMKAECNDRFLVVALICAAEHYLYAQLGLDRSEGTLTKARIKHIKQLMESIDYDGRF